MGSTRAVGPDKFYRTDRLPCGLFIYSGAVTTPCTVESLMTSNVD